MEILGLLKSFYTQFPVLLCGNQGSKELVRNRKINIICANIMLVVLFSLSNRKIPALGYIPQSIPGLKS